MYLGIVLSPKSRTPFLSFLCLYLLFVSANKFINTVVQIELSLSKRLPADMCCGLTPFSVHNYGSIVMNCKSRHCTLMLF
jgi:hypothetical protein